MRQTFDCVSHSEDSLNALTMAVVRGQPIFLSLNGMFGMPRPLYGRRKAYIDRFPKNTELQQYLKRFLHPKTNEPTHYRHDIETVTDIINALSIIKKHGAREYLKNVFMTYQGFVLSYDKFYLNTPQKQENLFRQLRDTARMRDLSYTIDVPNDRCAYGIPRLVRFKPCYETRTHPNMILRSSDRVTIERGYISEILLRNTIGLREGVDIMTSIFQKDAFLLACPMVNANDAHTKYSYFTFGKNKRPKFVEIDWAVGSATQVTSAYGHRLPRTYNPGQYQLL